MVSEVFHRLTRNLHTNFFRQPASQQLLKVALPIIGLIALYKAVKYYSKTTTVTDASKFKPAQGLTSKEALTCLKVNNLITTDTSKPKSTAQQPLIALTTQDELTRIKSETLKDPIPASLYCGVLERSKNHVDLSFQAHRWCNPTNLHRLVKLSTGKAYPANILTFPESKMSYILAESPLNNDIVD